MAVSCAASQSQRAHISYSVRKATPCKLSSWCGHPLMTASDSSAFCSQVLLEAALEAPDEVAADLSMLSADEANQLLHGFNATEAPAPADKTLSQLFEAQAAAKPEAACLLDGEHRLTYAEVSYPASHYNILLHSVKMQAATKCLA